MVTRFICLLVLGIFVSATPFPQTTPQVEQGIITYAVVYPKMTAEMSKLADVLPLKMTVTFRFNMMASEVSTPASYSKTIIDARSKDITILAHVNNRKILIKRPGHDPEQPKPKVFIERTEDTATIAGYLCKKAKIITLDLSNNTETSEVWYCEALGSPEYSYELNFEGLHGMLMRYTLKQGNIEMEYNAIKVEAKTIDKSVFVPQTAGYEQMSDRQFMHIMSR